MNSERKNPFITLRPYQIICVVCAIGKGDFSEPQYAKIKEVLNAVRENPNIPITLRCEAHSVYAFQDPGTGDDTPEGADYNRKRDLDILQKLDLSPGVILPAKTLFIRLFNRIKTTSGVCYYGSITSSSWKGCPLASNGNYERGWEKAAGAGGLDREIQGIISPRSREEMARVKRETVDEIRKAKAFFVRPHHLLCAICQYGSGLRPPYPEDNLPDFVEMIRKDPGLSVTLVQGAHRMMCGPCPTAVPELNACTNVWGSGGLSNEKRDLDLLQKLGLTYGSTMKARELYKLVFERAPTTKEICGRENSAPSVWWDGCGEANRTSGKEDYKKGKDALMLEWGLIQKKA